MKCLLEESLLLTKVCIIRQTIWSWNIVVPPSRIDPPLRFPLTNDHMCPPLSLFHGVRANTASNGRKKWGLHANFWGIVSSGNIHTKHNAVIITVQSLASSSVLRGLCCGDRIRGILECGAWMRCYDRVQSYFYLMSLRLAIIPCRQGSLTHHTRGPRPCQPQHRWELTIEGGDTCGTQIVIQSHRVQQTK